MGNTSKKVQEAGLIIGSLGMIGFLGLIWLMIYGNLSGNLGFARTTTSYVNESGYAINDTSYILTNGISTDGFVSLGVDAVYNATDDDGSLIESTNYTVDATTGTIVGDAGRLDDWGEVNISYTVTHFGNEELSTDYVIKNMTGGFRTFFGFSNTFFTIAAIVLLIFMLLGLLSMVWMIMAKQKGGSNGFSGY